MSETKLSYKNSCNLTNGIIERGGEKEKRRMGDFY